MSVTETKRVALIAAGTLCVMLGAIGLLIPVLPTTPFLLLAVACFGRSSKTLHHWLLDSPVFGECLRRYYSGEGMSARSKVVTLTFLWLSLGLSAYWLAALWLRLLLFAIGAGVSAFLLSVKTYRG